MCNVAVSGPEKALDDFLEKARKGGTLLFGNIVPRPEALLFGNIVPRPEALDIYSAANPDPELQKENTEAFGYKNWYDWNVWMWGTKWDLDEKPDSDQFQRENRKAATFSFDTAWAPPIPFFTACAERFPALEFALEYGEPGMCFAGRAEWAGGKLQSEADYPERSVAYKRICGWDDDDEEPDDDAATE